MLNELLINDNIEEIFTFSYVSLLPKENKITYISCGDGSLWKIDGADKKILQIYNRNIGLGIDTAAEFRKLPFQECR